MALGRFALRTRCRCTRLLDHDPYRYRTEALLAAGEADAPPLGGELCAAAAARLALDVPAIVLGHPSMAGTLGARGADRVHPAAPPGVDTADISSASTRRSSRPACARATYRVPGVAAEIAGRLRRRKEPAMSLRASLRSGSVVPIRRTA